MMSESELVITDPSGPDDKKPRRRFTLKAPEKFVRLNKKMQEPESTADPAVPEVSSEPVAAAPARDVLPETNSIDLYADYFGLTERPFSLVPDPEFLYWSDMHKRAYTMLEYGILTRAPITLITGEVGAGKTTLVHHLLSKIGKNVRVGLISNAHGSRGELLRWVLMALDQPADPAANYVDLFSQFQQYLIAQYASGNRVALIFDEAQNLSRESLEELRMFTNINSNKDELLQLVLVGQPELRDTITRPDMVQFTQRIAANFHLSRMDTATVRQYIAHRLKVAGAQQNYFTTAATELIHEITSGVPRLVNQLADLAMVYTFSDGRKRVMAATVQKVLDDGAFLGVPTPAKLD